MLSSQTVFNKAATHLLKQGKRGVVKAKNGSVHARYKKDHGQGGCALHPFVTKNYTKKMEDSNVYASVVQDVLRSNGINTDRDLALLSDLQILHDTVDAIDWPDALAIVANAHGLKMVKTKPKVHA